MQHLRKSMERPDYLDEKCRFGIDCKKKDFCPFRHFSQQFEHRIRKTYSHIEFYKLVGEREWLNDKFEFITHTDYQTGVDKTTDEYKEAQARIKYLQHLFDSHRKESFNVTCEDFGHRSCKQLGYYYAYDENKSVEIRKRIRKVQNMRKDPRFMHLKVGFGKHKEKTWLQVEKYYPEYIDWIVENFTSDSPALDIAKVIVEKRLRN